MNAGRPLLVLGFTALAVAADRPWTLDAIMAIASVADPQISPDGQRVACVVRSANLARNRYEAQIRLVDAAGLPSSALPAPHPSDHSPRWSPDGRLLAFLSAREGKQQVYVADLAGRSVRQVTHSPAGVTFFAWSPQGREIGYLEPDPPAPDEAARVAAGDDAVVAGAGEKYSRIHIAPFAGGESRLVSRADRHVISFDWSPDGRRIVYAGQTTPRNRDAFHVDLFEIDLASRRDTPVVVQPGRDADPAWSRDGKWIAFHSQAGSLDYFAARHVGIVPAAGGAVRYLTEGFEGDVFRGANRFWWGDSDRTLSFVAGRGAFDYLYTVDVRSGAAVRRRGPAASGFSFSRDGARCAYLKAGDDLPPEVYLAELAQPGAREKRLTHVHDALAAYPRVPVRTVQWKSKDGMPMEGVLWLPAGYRPGRPVPLLVELHGGPTGVALHGFPNGRTYPTLLFVQEGFAIFAPNFRGSSNYGAKLRLANIQSQGFGDFDDVMTGVDALVAQGIADPARLGVMGWSYGGFLAAWIVGHTDRFRAASIGAPGTDWITWYGASDGPREVLWTYFGGKPWDRWQIYNRHSPRYSLANLRTPALLQHGERDIDHSPEIYQALTDLGVPVEFVTYPREGHGIAEPAHQRDLMQRNLAWFLKWIGKP